MSFYDKLEKLKALENVSKELSKIKIEVQNELTNIFSHRYCLYESKKMVIVDFTTDFITLAIRKNGEWGQFTKANIKSIELLDDYYCYGDKDS